MNESYKAESSEVILTIEEAKYNFELAMHDLSEAAMSFGKFEAGRMDTDIGRKDILKEKRAEAEAASEAYMKVVEVEGIVAGTASR